MKRYRLNRKFRDALATLFALAVFILPTILGGWYVYATTHKSDPRHLEPTAAFHIRKVDQTTAPLVPFKEPLVSITFDDGWETVYTAGFPITQRYGFHTTQYIITNTLTYPGYMSIAQLKAMRAAGTQIASHTESHADLTTLDSQHVTKELSGSQTILESDFGGKIVDFTSPYGAFDEYTLSQIGKYYRSQKNAEGTTDDATDTLRSINMAGTFNPMNIISLTVTKDTTLANIQQLLADTEANNGWLVLTYHQIDNTSEQFSVSPTVFAQQMQLISNSPLRSVTVGQFMDAYEQGK